MGENDLHTWGTLLTVAFWFTVNGHGVDLAKWVNFNSAAVKSFTHVGSRTENLELLL